MSQLLKLGVFVVIFATMSAVIARHVSKDIKSVRCKNSIAMEGDIPDPLDCSKFYTCAPAPIESGEETMPVRMNCSIGDHGTLYYNFRKCQCDFEDTGCYNAADPADRADFFLCAHPYNPSSTNDYSPTQS